MAIVNSTPIKNPDTGKLEAYYGLSDFERYVNEIVKYRVGKTRREPEEVYASLNLNDVKMAFYDRVPSVEYNEW